MNGIGSKIAVNHDDYMREDNKSLKNVIQEIRWIYGQLKNRWGEFQRFQDYRKNAGHFKQEPVFTDEEGNLIKSSKALAPSKVVNTCLDRYVNLTLQIYNKELQGTLFHTIQNHPQLRKMVNSLRQIAIHAEESMEKEAMELIFKSIQNNPETYRERITKFAQRSLKEEPSLCPNVALLKAMVVDFPKWNQQRNPAGYPGLVFKYFDNYVNLVQSELQLFKQKDIQNDFTTKRSNSIHNLNAMTEHSLTIRRVNSSQSLRVSQNSLTENMENLRGSLSSKIFTFVGAGFPLTGIILHQKTGAQVNLVDCDKEAVNNANRFISLCEDCGIVEKNKLKVIHANALDLKFQTPHNKTTLPENTKQSIVKTDVLDLASAIPSRVTDEILKNNVHPDVLVRKRNVQGMSKLLYERYDLKDNTPYEVVAEVTTPQDALNRNHLKDVVGITKKDNINSCELFARKPLTLNPQVQATLIL